MSIIYKNFINYKISIDNKTYIVYNNITTTERKW